MQAQDLTGLRVLPHAGAGSTFSGWQSEGEVPSALDVPLDLGDEVYGATLQLQPAHAGETWRVRVQYETSLVLSAGGPHLDLTDWKHCVSEWEPAARTGPVSFVLPTPTPEQQACFPDYTPAELERAVREAVMDDPAQADRWLQGLRAGPAAKDSPVSPFAGISAVRARIEVLRKGGWVAVATLTFLPPMGC
ncbi:hypothetical protein CSC62_00840 [Pseudoxanthomonas jiangsuensis]|uniref:hypothetical protein n=1 Tax=Pseudoxanthomonas jiangsuensis TaxID=619688 RepID=UPI0013910D22|nr:hypothetical protein [Pseudoxanthomonas jiangsuensis]KAF1699480.1 hypothetical protein CSC62_00840 [Pseudoxanthomonas jiangsuensis]